MLYRDKAEVETWRQRDSLPNFRQYLLQHTAYTEFDLQGVEVAIKTELDKAVAFAIESPMPAPETALEGVYGETWGGRVF